MAWYLPFLIFGARILDVSIGTVRVIVIIRGHKFVAAALGFLEVTIWLLAVSAVLMYIRESVWTVVGYSSGFAMGTLVGMMIEERLALGNQIIRVVNTNREKSVVEFLRERGHVVTEVAASGRSGPHELGFLVVPRREAKAVVQAALAYCPDVFLTVEDIRSVATNSTVFRGATVAHLPLWRRLIKFR